MADPAAAAAAAAVAAAAAAPLLSSALSSVCCWTWYMCLQVRIVQNSKVQGKVGISSDTRRKNEDEDVMLIGDDDDDDDMTHEGVDNNYSQRSLLNLLYSVYSTLDEDDDDTIS
ncbi:uncharacterized protein LOC141528571 [Cotesia typhae]|uniref:uncharacterized protein LOC141528571 n=1 Tax=Cotesia typhae TaxID=2053667 RepID=UPI003D695E05